jgi:hypothetical protein
MLKTVNKIKNKEENLQCWFTALASQRDNSVKIAYNAKWPKELSIENALIGVMHHE